MGLRWSVAALFLSVPLALVESVILSQNPWWQMPKLHLVWVAAVTGLLCFGIVFSIFKARAFSTKILAVSFTACFLFSAGYAIYLKFPKLGLFALFTLLLFLGEWLWLRNELGKSYLDPKLKWYEGAPSRIPGLRCEWVDPEEGLYPFEVSRLDILGTALFRPHHGANSNDLADLIGKRERIQLKFQFKDRDLNLSAVPRLFWERQVTGVGLQFDHLSPDEKKNLADFVEVLKGEGYV